MGEVLYLKHRPKNFSEVIGQDEAIASLKSMKTSIPHAMLFIGPSGCGKTTLARILKEKLKCSDHDFQEINCADCRGIDDIRDIRAWMGSAPMGGPCRVYLLDECHQITSDGQSALLKMLEDTPSHIYFFLATTDPQKLKKTIITRCTEIRCKEISEKDLEKLVVDTAKKEEIELSEKVASRIAECADGSARKAQVLLHSVIGIEDEGEQLAAVEKGDLRSQSIEIARALLSTKTKWGDMAKILQGVEDDPEGIRWLVLAYMKSVLLKSGNPRAMDIIQEFRFDFYTSKMAGLVAACYEIVGRS